MADNVVPLRLVEVGEAHVFDVETVLASAKVGVDSTRPVAVIGYCEEDGSVYIGGTHGPAECLWLLALAQKWLLDNSDPDGARGGAHVE